ncbi:MAG: hypothetical protein WC551_03995 [Patescibacteria group bacterium]
MNDLDDFRKDLHSATPTRGDTTFFAKWFFWLLGLFVAVVVIAVAVSWVAGWGAVPVQVASAENVQKQFAFAYQYDESLQAVARQVCSAEKGVAESSSDVERTQRRSQALAFEQNYARIEAEFNAKLRNAFEAKYVAPSDVPKRAPTLTEMKVKVCGH